MKILIHSSTYSPSIGGIETVMELLADSFIKKGHEVTVVTNTLTEAKSTKNIVRNPSYFSLLKLARASDVILQANISIPTTWLLLASFRPLYVVHHTWYNSKNRSKNLLKQITSFFVQNISVSNEVLSHIAAGGRVIPNPYDQDVFKRSSEKTNNKNILFVGRLVSDKGVDVLIKALGILKNQNIEFNATIVGSGPERLNLIKEVEELQLASSVHFLQSRKDQELSNIYREHSIVVIPSTWSEPFGVVAVEALASGCKVIASKSGALPNLVRNFGKIYSPNDPQTLAQELALALSNKVSYQDPTEYLKQFEKERISEHYIAVMAGNK